MQMEMVDAIILITFIVVIFCGITGKGPIYKNENVHESKREEYMKKVRMFSLIDGPLGALSVILLWIPGDQMIWKVLSWICFGLALAGIILLMIYCYRVSDQYIKKKMTNNHTKK